MAQQYGLDTTDQLRTLELVAALSAGERDGDLATTDEHAPPPKNGDKAPDPPELEEFLGDGALSHQPPDYRTAAADPCVVKAAEGALPRLEEVPMIRGWREELAPRLDLPGLFEAVAISPPALLTPADLDKIGRSLADRPAYALPAYFGPLVEHFAAPVMAERLLGML